MVLRESTCGLAVADALTFGQILTAQGGVMLAPHHLIDEIAGRIAAGVPLLSQHAADQKALEAGLQIALDDVFAERLFKQELQRRYG